MLPANKSTFKFDNVFLMKPLKDACEEVLFKEVPEALKKNVVVVYNHFNIEAILAAAILAQCYKDFKVVTVAQNIPAEGELYVWVGVKPDQIGTKVLFGNKEHMTYSTHEQKVADELGRRPSIIDQICHDFCVKVTDRITKISFLASRFFMSNSKDMGLNDLAYVYNEMKDAIAMLNGVGRRILQEDEILEQYKKDVKIIQNQFRYSYKQIGVMEGNRCMDVIYTTFSDHNFVLALRLMRLAHANFVNHTHGLNGQLVYSNMTAPKLEDESKVILLN